MTYWLLAFKLNEPYFSINRYALAVLNPDPKDVGLCKSPIAEHAFPTIGAVIQFLVAHCNPVDISEVEGHLGNGQLYAMKVSKESALKMGFKIEDSD